MVSTDEAREQVRRRLDAVTEGSGFRAFEDPEADDAGPPSWLDEPQPGRSGVRLALGRWGVVALAVGARAAVALGLLAVWWQRPVTESVAPLPASVSEPVAGDHPPPSAAPAVSAPALPPPVDEIVVSVVGLVHTSGLVRLPSGARVADALTAAGGAREGADLLGLNLAQRLNDGDQVLVGLAPPPGAAPVAGSATVGAGAAPVGGGGGGGSGGKVNLNTATEQQLDELPGVGPVTATAIVSWRTGNGTFTDVEQLGEVDGIGPARLAKLRDLVTVG